MIFSEVYKQKIFSATPETFANTALELFRYQATENIFYKKFLQSLDVNPDSVNTLEQIPFLPVEFFKSQKLVSGDTEASFYFESSGTTDEIKSKHIISDLKLYEESMKNCFELFYGDITQYCFLALLPSYLERKNASLVYMCEKFMNWSNHPQNGFYLYDFKKLHAVLIKNEKEKQKTILLGVSFALLDFAYEFPDQLAHTIIMETGGMKGKRKEITREELHDELKKAFHISYIHSEYGMTELLSQAYAPSHGIFHCPPWMKILIRDSEDPFTFLSDGKVGCINIIDLANINSCSFIATQDLGKLYADNSFSVLGRFSNSDIRGCNLLVE